MSANWVSVSLRTGLSWVQHQAITCMGAELTHWGRVTHMCVNKITVIGWDNGLSPGRRQAIISTNDGILLIRTLGTNFSVILSEIHSFSFEKTHLKMSSAKWRLSRLGLNELMSILGGSVGSKLSAQEYVHFCICHGMDRIVKTYGITLIHCGLVRPYSNRDIGQHWCR